MNCPRCAGTVLTERERDGLSVDICPTCRGVWLDRGELEKLIARATRELDEDYARNQQTAPRVGDRDYDADDHHPHGRHPKRKRGWLDALGDIFD